MTPAAARNIAIILAIAALVDVIPGGGTGASVALQAVYLVFIATLGWFAALMYRQRRSSLYSLGERRRALLYAAIAVGAVVLTGTTRMWQTSAGQVAWLILLGVAVYAIIAIFWSARRY
jgi:hypothetical protein